jgi:hypothetical protein
MAYLAYAAHLARTAEVDLTPGMAGVSYKACMVRIPCVAHTTRGTARVARYRRPASTGTACGAGSMHDVLLARTGVLPALVDSGPTSVVACDTNADAIRRGAKGLSHGDT